MEEQIKVEDNLVQKSGSCGEELRWRLENGMLHIEGSGSMRYKSKLSVKERFELRKKGLMIENDGPIKYEQYPWHKYREQIERVVIEEGCTEIGVDAFRDCVNLSFVQLPNTLEMIISRAFQNCGSLTFLELPDSVSYIGENAFWKCNKLEKLVIPYMKL